MSNQSPILLSLVVSLDEKFKLGKVFDWDPLFSLSFCAVADYFSRLIEKRLEEGLIEGFRLNKNGAEVASLQFVDDSYLFIYLYAFCIFFHFSP